MLKRMSRNERGQVLLLFIFLLPVLLGMVGFALDTGLLMVYRRNLQNAADAAALAAVSQLPNANGASDLAYEYTNKNGFVDGVDGVTVAVTNPYGGDPEKIEVIITRPVRSVFMGVVGVTETAVSARAVGVRQASAAYGPAIFAGGEGCGTPHEVRLSGSDIDIVGDVITNGSFRATGSDIYAEGTLSHICADPVVNNGTFTGGFDEMSGPAAWPIEMDYSDFDCDFSSSESNSPWLINPSNTPELYDDPSTGLLKSGVYCHNSDINVSQGATGTVTFASKKGVYLTGGPYDLTAYQDDVLIFAHLNSTYAPCPGRGRECFGWDDAAVHISSNGFTWEGIIYAPRGEIQFSAASFDSPSGGLYGYTVQTSASSGQITGMNEGAGGPAQVRLVE